MRIPTSHILEQLEVFYGKQEPSWPTDPYLFLVWWHCGYPASDAACQRGWESLNKGIGVEPDRLLAASMAELANALTPGGMVPAVRAKRLKEIAARVKEEFHGDLTKALCGSEPMLRKALKKFPHHVRFFPTQTHEPPRAAGYALSAHRTSQIQAAYPCRQEDGGRL